MDFAPDSLPSLDTPETSVDPPSFSVPCCASAPHAQLDVLYRHRRWTADRLTVYGALRVVGTSDARLLAFAECGRNAWLMQAADHPGEYRVRGSLCRHRWCQRCARERSRDFSLQLQARWQNADLRFVTLTLRTANPALKPEVERLVASFRKLRQRKIWKSTQTDGVAFLEVKWNATAARWHPHLHVITRGTYLPHADLKAAWHKCTGDSWVVDIRAVRTLNEAAAYVAKYASKPYDSRVLEDPARLIEAMLALKGKRTVIPFGLKLKTRERPDADKREWIPVAKLSAVLAAARAGNEVARLILSRIGDNDQWKHQPKICQSDTYARAP